MILKWDYQAFGRKPEFIYGLGMVLRRSGTDTAQVTTATSFLEYTAPQRTFDCTAPDRSLDYTAPQGR